MHLAAQTWLGSLSTPSPPSCEAGFVARGEGMLEAKWLGNWEGGG